NGNTVNRAPNNSTDLQPAFGGEFYPGLHKPKLRKFANPSPLGLCAFAVTWFVVSLVNAQARGVGIPNIAVGLAYGYGGLVQLLAGMWEFAAGNTFGATAFTSYGGFWLSWAMMQTSSFGISSAYAADINALNNALGYYLIAWFIFTTMLLFCTLKSTVALFSMFLMLDLTFLLLAISRLQAVDGNYERGPHKAAGVTGCITAFLAWWNALAGLTEQSNCFFTVPVFHFPWSEKAKFDRKNRT
ncbi:Accumulation of DYads protein, partial [Rhizina undulata]